MADCPACKTKIEALEKRVEELELRIYHDARPTLRLCMEGFNRRFTCCFCDYCMFAGRAQDHDADFDNWRATHPDRMQCSFNTGWEEFLRRIGASYEVLTESEDPASGSQRYNYSGGDVCLYKVGSDGWEFARWGNALSSKNSPRKLVWEKIMDECLLGNDSGAEYDTDDDGDDDDAAAEAGDDAEAEAGDDTEADPDENNTETEAMVAG